MRYCVRTAALLMILVAALSGCRMQHRLERIERERIAAGIALESRGVQENRELERESTRSSGKLVSYRRGSQEAMAYDTLNFIKVEADFTNVAERNGAVGIEFNVKVPKELQNPQWQVRISPLLVRGAGDTVKMDIVNITGGYFRKRQLLGYDRYSHYLDGIIMDSTGRAYRYERQMNLFLYRNPHFGGEGRARVERYYTRWGLLGRNERRRARSERVFREYVKNPIEESGVRMDTVVWLGERDILYRYSELVPVSSGTRRMEVLLSAVVKGSDGVLINLPRSGPVQFYISSVTTLADYGTAKEEESQYAEGMAALKERDYRRAVELLSEYGDMNSAVAMLCAERNLSALNLLRELPKSARRDYLMALALSRRGRPDEAMEMYRSALGQDSSYLFRANLDPEIKLLTNKYNSKQNQL